MHAQRNQVVYRKEQLSPAAPNRSHPSRKHQQSCYVMQGQLIINGFEADPRVISTILLPAFPQHTVHDVAPTCLMSKGRDWRVTWAGSSHTVRVVPGPHSICKLHRTPCPEPRLLSAPSPDGRTLVCRVKENPSTSGT